MNRPLCLFPALAVCLLIGANAQATTPYYFTDIGSLPGGPVNGYSIGNAINDAGVLTGQSQGFRSYAITYSAGTITNLGTLAPHNASQFSIGYSINSNGDVAGGAYTWTPDGPLGKTHAFLYHAGTMTDLGSLTGNTDPSNSTAYAVNNNLEVTGGSIAPTGDMHAFIYSGGTMTDIGRLPGTTYNSGCVGYGINDSGTVAGQCYVDGFTPHAVLYSNGTWTDAGSLIGASGASSFRSVNNNGQAVGYSAYNSGGYSGTHAVLYSNGMMQDLGTPGSVDSYAYAVNSSGTQVVGILSDQNTGNITAMVWKDGAMYDLNGLCPTASAVGWTLSRAYGVNSSGQITGYAQKSDGTTHGYRLDPAVAGDANLDGAVDVADLNRALTNYNKTGMAWADGDFDGDGAVTVTDLNKVLTNYNKGAGTPAGLHTVPEPGMLALLAMVLAVAALRVRRR